MLILSLENLSLYDFLGGLGLTFFFLEERGAGGGGRPEKSLRSKKGGGGCKFFALGFFKLASAPPLQVFVNGPLIDRPCRPLLLGPLN